MKLVLKSGILSSITHIYHIQLNIYYPIYYPISIARDGVINGVIFHRELLRELQDRMSDNPTSRGLVNTRVYFYLSELYSIPAAFPKMQEGLSPVFP